MHTHAELDSDLLADLASAVETCRDALADYRAGLIDGDELRDEVVTGGHLVRLRDAIEELAAGGVS